MPPPAGPPLAWGDAARDALSQVTVADQAVAARLWERDSLPWAKTLLDAEEEVPAVG